jgi:membrane protein CcdC involved in cytochrome C biogenesis
MDKTKQERIASLKKKAKTFKMISIVYASILVMMCILAFVATQRDGIGFLTFLPLFFVPMEIVNLYQYKKAKKQIEELERRNG